MGRVDELTAAPSVAASSPRLATDAREALGDRIFKVVCLAAGCSVLVILGNLLADVLYSALDPRVAL